MLLLLVTWQPPSLVICYASMLMTQYLTIPAQNYQSRSAELDHIETWAACNNLHLNRAKCVELIISDPRRRRQFNLPPCISDITRVSSLKIIGVTITSKMSVSEHLRFDVLTRDSHTGTSKPRDGWCPVTTHLPCRSYCKTYIMLLAPGGVSPMHLTDSVSKASYAVGAAMVYIPPTNLQ